MDDKKKDLIELIINIYCDVSNMFLNVSPNVVDRLKSRDIDDILLAKQAFIKSKLVTLIDNINEKESNLSARNIPFEIQPKDILDQLKID